MIKGTSSRSRVHRTASSLEVQVRSVAVYSNGPFELSANSKVVFKRAASYLSSRCNKIDILPGSKLSWIMGRLCSNLGSEDRSCRYEDASR